MSVMYSVRILQRWERVRFCEALLEHTDAIWQCRKRTEKGDLFSKNTIAILVFDKASLSRSWSYFQCDDGVYQTGSAVMAAALTRATCLGSTKRLSRSLVESHCGIPGDLSLSFTLFVYKPMPVLTVPSVWEETITGSLHSQIILQPDALHGLDSEWILALLPYLGSHFRETDDTAPDK